MAIVGDLDLFVRDCDGTFECIGIVGVLYQLGDRDMRKADKALSQFA
jgi:hypothetical protein